MCNSTSLFILVTAISCCLQTCLAATPTRNKSPMTTNPRNNHEASDTDAYSEDFLMGGNSNFHPMHHHHHHRDFPGGFQHDPNFHRDDPNFPTPSTLFPDEGADKPREIPLEYVRNLLQYNVSDLLLNYVEGMEEDEAASPLENRFGGDVDERNAAVTPEEAKCRPELAIVELGQSDDPNVLFFPHCTRVERCGGCCRNPLISCQPTEVETVTYKVLKAQYTGAKKMKYLGKENILVERHTKCDCLCKVKRSNCNIMQEYNESGCKCACKNVDEEKKCYKQMGMKLWNPDTCACECRRVTPCTSGYSFSPKECRCMGVQMRRRFASSSSDNDNNAEVNYPWDM